MAGSDEFLSYTSKVDALVDRIDALLDQHQKGASAITVTHTQSSNAGFYVGVAVTACVATVALMVAFMIIENRSYAHLDNQVDQLRAWSDVHGKEIARLQAQKPKE